MNKLAIKTYLGEIVVNSDLTKPAKLQLLKYIQKEEDDHQLMSLALDGEIIALDEDTKQIIEDRFFESDVMDIILEDYVSELNPITAYKKIKYGKKAMKAKGVKKGSDVWKIGRSEKRKGQATLAGYGVAGGGVALVMKRAKFRKACKEKHGNDPQSLQACLSKTPKQ